MSIEAKQMLKKELRDLLEDRLTAKQMATIMEEADAVLAHYTVDRDRETAAGMEFDEMLEAFLSAKRVEGRSEKTLQHYQYILGRLRDSSTTPIRDMSVHTLRSFLAEEQARGISDKTLEGVRNVFSSFFGWLQKERLIAQNLCANLGPIKCAKKVRHPFADTDIECLKERCKTQRDRAILCFLLSTGCRISEVCALNRNSVDFQALECTVLGKGNKERTVFLDDVSAMQLQRYLSERTDLSAALFTGRRSDRMTPNGVRTMLKKLAAEAMVENVHPHRFRRTLATNLIDRGMTIQEVASILGHEKLDTTLKYVYIDKENIRNAYRKYA